jgi:hypothetical protein
MLAAAILTRIRNYITAELRPRDLLFREGLLATQRRMAPRQGASSGAFAHACIDLGKDELQIRAGLIWAAIQRSYSSLSGRDGPGLAEDLEQQVAEYLTAEARTVSGYAAAMWQGNDKIFLLVRDSINIEPRNQLRDRFNVEVQFYVDGLARAAAVAAGASGSAATHVMNFNAPVGAVQAGAGSIAHVSFAAGDNQRLVDALEALQRAIETNTEMPEAQRAGSLEIASDIVAATKADKPNTHKILGLLNGLAQSVQTVAGLHPAWEAVRNAAIIMGAWFS